MIKGNYYLTGHELEKGAFVISLDFELFWGVRDKRSIDDYRANLLGARDAIPRILELFEKYGIHATWATVGFLFFKTREELLQCLPAVKPGYLDSALSPYNHLEALGCDEREDPYHFAGSLVDMIEEKPGQEIGSHTFSHYYCVEPGQDVDSFRADLEAVAVVFKKRGLPLKSIVFPRNQVNEEYLDVLAEKGITSYRGAPWYHIGKKEKLFSYVRAAIRFADSYLPFLGKNSISADTVVKTNPYNIQSNRMLRPCSRRFRFLEPLRLSRMKKDMAWAARHKRIFHIWWHPHNFGADPDSNLQFLEKLLQHYKNLRDEYGFDSCNMQEVSERMQRVR